MSTETTYSGNADTKAGLTPHGCQRAVSAHCSLEGDREGVGAQRSSLRSMFSALVRQDGPLSDRDLRPYFHPANADVPKQGHYGMNRHGRFLDEVGYPQLLNVPGVEETADGLQFVGADPEAFDVSSEHLRPLDDVRGDPRTQALNTLDSRLGPHADAREDIMTLWDAATNSGAISREELERGVRVHVSEEGFDVLAELPGIERTLEQPPDPSEITIETYQDVLDAREAVDGAEPETVWRVVE